MMLVLPDAPYIVSDASSSVPPLEPPIERSIIEHVQLRLPADLGPLLGLVTPTRDVPKPAAIWTFSSSTTIRIDWTLYA